MGAYGALFTVQSLGMAVGCQVNPRRRRVIVMCLLFALNDVFVVAMALTLWFGAALGLVALRGLCIGFGIGVWYTLMMQFVPENKLARVSSLDFFGSFALVPAGYALTAILAGTFAPSSLLIVGFGLSAVLWSAPFALRRVREAA